MSTRVTTGEMALGIAVLGAVVGGVYFVTRKAAATPTATPTPAFTMGVMRPSAPTGGFSSTAIVQVPPGVDIALTPGGGVTKTAVLPADYVTLTLPPGATWVGVAIGNTSNPSVAAQVPLNGNLTDRVSLPLSAISGIGGNVIMAVWTDSAGKTQGQYVEPAVEKKPLTL
jgi:hypothetical protein